MLVDFWTQHYAENPVSEEFSDDDFDLDAELAKVEAEGEAAETARGAAPDSDLPPDEDFEEI